MCILLNVSSFIYLNNVLLIVFISCVILFILNFMFLKRKVFVYYFPSLKIFHNFEPSKNIVKDYNLFKWNPIFKKNMYFEYYSNNIFWNFK